MNQRFELFLLYTFNKSIKFVQASTVQLMHLRLEAHLFICSIQMQFGIFGVSYIDVEFFFFIQITVDWNVGIGIENYFEYSQ